MENFKQYWFLFQLIIRFMAFHVEDHKLDKGPRPLRFPPSITEELTIVIQVRHDFRLESFV